MKNDKTIAAFRGASVSEFLQGILSDVSLNASNATLFYTNYSNLEGSISIQRQSISGVDNDEEGINLVKYQNSYNLAATMIQTLTEVYDRLILQTGV
jgi:flagellar hook-associated protein 1 FlgK